MVYSFYGCRDHYGATPKDRLDEIAHDYNELAVLLDEYHQQHTNVSMHIFISAVYIHRNSLLEGQVHDRVLVVFNIFVL